VARKINRLSARAVETLKKPGRHADGGSLYLVIDGAGAKRWVFLFRWRGRLREMGLGSLKAVPLASAREAATAARQAVAAGRDPIADKKAAASSMPTFGAFTDKFLENKGPGWRNAKHRQQWRNTLATYAASLRRQPVDAITTEDVLSVLKPIWTAKSETASRLRGRIEQILDAARAAGHRSGENPARWKGHLDQLLSKRQKLTRGHHPAMAYQDVPAFVASLQAQQSVTAMALEFTIMTVARSGEALSARWSEIDIAQAVWTVPGKRMKGGREHRVPLTERALEILAEAQKMGASEFVFPGTKPRSHLSSMAMAMLMRRMKIENATPHGFRSSFRDWAGDSTSFPREVAEAALAHAVGDETEQAYRRSDALAKRRKLMDVWSRFCTTKIATVLPFTKPTVEAR
jgi:integrase